MACPLCNQKPLNCDCTLREISRFRELSELQEECDQMHRDAARYRWLSSRLVFMLGSYNGPDSLSNATESQWTLQSTMSFEGTNTRPSSVDAAIDKAMKSDTGMTQGTGEGE